MYSELEGQYSHINVADYFVLPGVGVVLVTQNGVQVLVVYLMCLLLYWHDGAVSSADCFRWRSDRHQLVTCVSQPYPNRPH